LLREANLFRDHFGCCMKRINFAAWIDLVTIRRMYYASILLPRFILEFSLLCDRFSSAHLSLHLRIIFTSNKYIFDV
jgi:hypothetical protein